MPRKKNGTQSLESPKRITLQDIADVAGVQRMTVSNVMNDTGGVSPTVRAKVKQIARELNYVPNFAARALSTGRTGIVAIITGALNEPYYANVVHILEKCLRKDGYYSILMRTPAGVQNITKATSKIPVDGAIAIDMVGLIDEFHSHPRIPCVALGTVEHSFADCVIADLSGNVEEAVELMLSADRKRVAYLVTSNYMAQEQEVRTGAYIRAMRRSQRSPEIINIQHDILNFEAIDSRFKAYVAQRGCPDALLCQNDEIAMCVFAALTDLGYEVPRDVLLVGCDGQQYMKFFNPPLSTIAQPIEEMCALAWQFLKNRMADASLPQQKAAVKGKLIVRQSLGSVKTPPDR